MIPECRAVLIAYGLELFDLEAAELRALKVAPDVLRTCLQELGNRVYGEMRRPVITQCRVELGALPLDQDYARRLGEALRGRVDAASPAQKSQFIQKLNEYLRRKDITVTEFAREVRVDRSVIYALRRGKLKCSRDALQRVADRIGGSVEDFLNATAHGVENRARPPR